MAKRCIRVQENRRAYWRYGKGKGMVVLYRGADKFLARPGRKQATATEDFDVNISYL